MFNNNIEVYIGPLKIIDTSRSVLTNKKAKFGVSYRLLPATWYKAEYLKVRSIIIVC